VVHLLPSDFHFNLQPSTFNLQPSTFNLQPSTFNLQPSAFSIPQTSPHPFHPSNPWLNSPFPAFSTLAFQFFSFSAFVLIMLSLEYLAELSQRYPLASKVRVASFELKGRLFDSTQRPSFMGVINLSPDSWYRESVCLTADAAIQRGHRLHAEGADLVDLGDESTLAHAEQVDAKTQTDLLIPIIKGLGQSGILSSVETYHPTVAKSCLKAGAAVLNLTGTEGTEEFYKLVADHDAGVVICFVQGENVRKVGNLETGEDFADTLKDYFVRQIDLATDAGVSRIWIDPGMGFYYKNMQDSQARVQHQMNTFLQTFRLRTLGWPVCHALPHAFEYFEDEVRSSEAFFAVLALLGKTDLLRTHEIPKVRAVAKTLAAF
jgi:dihydropteroate synthase